MKGILGKKIGMTQIFDDQGQAVPVTVIEAGPCVVTQKKTKEKDGYQALQIGFAELPERKVNKPMKKHFEKSKKLLKHLTELRIDDAALDSVRVGTELGAGLFAKSEVVKISGNSIGKGFAGGIKRWNFARQAMTHGCKARRLPGSMGATDRGGKVLKGKKMPGKMGNKTSTISNLKIVDIKDNVLLVKGAVPGPKNGIVFIYNDQKIDFANLGKSEAKQKAQVKPQEAKEKTDQSKKQSETKAKTDKPQEAAKDKKKE